MDEPVPQYFKKKKIFYVKCVNRDDAVFTTRGSTYFICIHVIITG